MKKFFYLLFLTILFPGIPETTMAQGDYLIGPEDVLEISVWGHDDLKKTMAVSLEGAITFPLIGEIRAAGKSTQALENELSRRLGDGYLVNPQITVAVKEFNSQKVFVVGEVNRPGLYPVTRENHILHIISQAGGPTKEAGEEVVIIRPKNHKHYRDLTEAEANRETIFRINLRNVLLGDQHNNIPIKDGDSVLVPKIPPFFVMGEVKNPGKFNYERGLTVLMGISMGGGLTTKAAPNRTRIVREVDGKKIEIKAGFDTILQPGDTIIVPESFF